MSEEMIYIGDYDKLTKDLENERKFKEKVGDLLKEDNRMVNDEKTEILKRLKHMKNSKSEPCRHTIKLGLKLGDKEDIAYRKQL